MIGGGDGLALRDILRWNPREVVLLDLDVQLVSKLEPNGPTEKLIAELERRMRVNDRVLRYLTVRVDEDRRRAEKLKDRRARKAAKRPVPGAPARRGGREMEFAAASGDE